MEAQSREQVSVLPTAPQAVAPRPPQAFAAKDLPLTTRQVGDWMFGAVALHAALDRPEHTWLPQCRCYWGCMYRRLFLWRIENWPESLPK